MRGAESERKRRRLGRVVFWLGVGLLVVAVTRSISVTEIDRTDGVDRAADGSVIRTIRVKTVDRHPDDPNWREAEQGEFDLTAGETTSISAQALPIGRPLILNLLLPAALPDAEALPARIISMDGGGELKLPDAVAATDRDRVRVQVESGWLSTGRYRIEIEAVDRSGLAPQPYLLEVR